ncbi:MAG: glycosyltransferase family 39 protein [Candidatus Omnitrophica bacterium]|nr:glycosyltransferase family 39 protein [Candidatus Omnitrophota bacterium]
MSKDLKYILALIVLSYFFLFYGNNLISLTNPDEVFYVQTAKEMVQCRSWMTPILFDQPQFEKPILLYWLLRISFLIFGVNNFSGRFFCAFFALVGVVAVYLLARLLFEEKKKAFICALVLLSCGFYMGMGRTVFTDMPFSVLILLALLSFFWKQNGVGIILFFIFSALAVLAKGPLGLLIPLLTITIFLILTRRIKLLFSGYILLGVVIFLVIALPWYILMTAKYGWAFLQEFFYNDHYRRLVEAEHPGNDTWYFYPLTMLGCMFPWTLFLAASLVYLFWRIKRGDASYLFIFSWIISVFLIFQSAHSKLTSYILPLFPALALTCGSFIYDSAMYRKRQFSVLLGLMWIVLLLMAVGIVFAALKFSSYLSSIRPIYFIALVFIFWLGMSFFCFLRKKYMAAIYLLALYLPAILSVIPFIHRDIDPYLSSEAVCAYLVQNYPADKNGYLISSKAYVRGTRYYTGRKVAVFAPYAKNFFSPHPIPFLDSDEKARDFLRKQPLFYCFLKKSSLGDLKRVADKEFVYQIIKHIGNQYLVKIEQAENYKK